MANKALFQSFLGKLSPATDSFNEENLPAYSLGPKQALAQYAATGCLIRTFYASAEDQLATVLELCSKPEVDSEFIARVAIWCREEGAMKDMPALLCAVLSTFDPILFRKVFDRVIDNGRMLRTFVQIMRSGQAGRKSLGTVPKKKIRQWLESRSDEAVFEAAVGQSPSLADVVKMVHPKPSTRSREALYGYLIGRSFEFEALPAAVRKLEDWKAGRTKETPQVLFQMLTSLPLERRDWVEIANRAAWQMTRMNLNSFARHGVFEVPGMTEIVARRLADPVAIRKARVFPYQLMVANRVADRAVPGAVREALEEAMEIAIGNVPEIDGKVYVCPDVSGSMRSPVTGVRAGATSAVRCVDVAALVAAAIIRKNPEAEVLPFEHQVVDVRLSRRDSVMTNAEKLAAVGGGGTSTSAPLARLNQQKAKGNLVIFVSDNESWADARRGRGTETMQQWSAFRQRNPGARLVCIDIQPYGTTQAASREDVLNVGGFSDEVFEVVREFASGRLAGEQYVGLIEAVAV